MKSMISVADLRARGACENQLALFRATFSEGVAVTEANMSRAVDVGLWVEWLECLLTAPAWAEYKAVTAPARESYKVATAQARESYKVACDQALTVTVKARAAMDQAYDEAGTAYRHALVGPLVRALRA